MDAADISWDQTSVEKHATYLENEVTASWTLTNNGEQPVSIVTLSIGCACAHIRADQQIIPPEGTSTVTATFIINDRVGLQRQQATVTLADGIWPTDINPPEEHDNSEPQTINQKGRDHSPEQEQDQKKGKDTPVATPSETSSHALAFSVQIEQPIRTSRKVLFWRLGSTTSSKSVIIHIDNPKDYSLLGIEGLPRFFQTQIVPNKDPHNTTLLFTPTDTTIKTAIKCQITTTHPGKQYAKIPLTLLIK